MTRLILCFSFFILSISIHAQELSDLIIDSHYNGSNLKEVVSQLNTNFDLKILSINDKILNKTISNISKPTRIIPFLESQLKGYSVQRITEDIVIIDEETEKKIRYGFASKYYSTKIKVVDELTKDPLIGASVLFSDLTGDLTDINGFYSFVVEKNLTEFTVSYVGYEPVKYRLILTEEDSTQLHIPMRSSTALENINIYGKKQDFNVSNKNIGVQSLKIENIKQLPTFMGDIDPIKGITTLPGVGSTGDISAGFHVRGGNNSQNLIIQDGAIIFNPTHLFGFFSAFNPDFINSISLHKGIGSAQYGSRVSSVLDIKNKNGDLFSRKISGGIGAVSSRLTVESPIKKGSSSLIIGGRMSYASWFLKNYEDVRLKNSFANFHDITGKYFQKINDKNYISLSGYYSYDDFNLGIDSTFTWNTRNIALKWDHKYDEQHNSSLKMASSNYASTIESTPDLYAYKAYNGININTLSYEHRYSRSTNQKFLAGFNINRNLINPGYANASNDKSLYEDRKISPQHSIESGIYVESEVDISKHLGLRFGLRYSHFFRYGRDRIYDLDYNNIVNRHISVIDTLYKNKGDFYATYGGIEPRISARYKLFKSTAIKIGYHRSKQYITQITTTFSPSPFDFWASSSNNIKPQNSDQYTIGLFRNLQDNNLELSIEGYLKNTTNVIDYIGGVDLDKNELYETGLLQGKNKSFGIETIFKKKLGKLNGWLSYTYMHSYNIFDNSNDALDINFGQKYSSIYDKPHQLNAVINFEITKTSTLGFSFIYTSGQPLTIPISKFSYDDFLSVTYFSERNKYRAPDYHRLDISLTFKRPERYDRRYYDELVIGLYNVYGQKNAYSIFFDKYALGYKTSIIGSVIPSISYNFRIK